MTPAPKPPREDGKCRDCGAKIVWMLTRNDRWIPIDAETAHLAGSRRGEDGRIIFDKTLHRVHFNTCTMGRKKEEPPKPPPSSGQARSAPPPPQARPKLTPEQQAHLTLQVVSDAHPDVVKAAYKALAFIYHPDRNPLYGEKMKQINAAYDLLREKVGR